MTESTRDPKFNSHFIEISNQKTWDFTKGKSYNKKIAEELKFFMSEENNDFNAIAEPFSKLPQISKLNVTLLACAISIYQTTRDCEEIFNNGKKFLKKSHVTKVKTRFRLKDPPKEEPEMLIKLDILRYLILVCDIHRGEVYSESSVYTSSDSEDQNF